MKKIQMIKSCVFMMIVATLFVALAMLVRQPKKELRITLEDFYNLPENTVDVLLLSPSSLETFWNSTKSYHDEGLAAFGFTSSLLPVSQFQYLIEEAYKTQNPKLVIIDLTTVDSVSSPTDFYTVYDTMKFSKTKLAAIDCAIAELSAQGIEYDKNYYLYSFLKYHSAIGNVLENIRDILSGRGGGRNGPYLLGYYFQTPTNQSLEAFPSYDPSAYRGVAPVALGEKQQTILSNLLDYCDALDADILFTYCAQALPDRFHYWNFTTAYVKERGYNVLNLADYYYEIGLDWENDYYNNAHTNYRGAEKVTAWFGKYLKENYDLPDRRGDGAHSFWEKEYQRYIEMCNAFEKDTDKDWQ